MTIYVYKITVRLGDVNDGIRWARQYNIFADTTVVPRACEADAINKAKQLFRAWLYDHINATSEEITGEQLLPQDCWLENSDK